MKRIAYPCIIAMLIFICCCRAFACTSFAVHSKKVLYGMNFDYPDVKVKYIIYNNGGKKVFVMRFMLGLDFSTTVGMNSEGVFASCQLLYPDERLADESNSNIVDIGSVFMETLFSASSVKEVRKFVSKKTISCGNVTRHDLVADKSGDAAVLEAGGKGNLVTDIGKEKCIVMTNFYNSLLKNTKYKDISGVGTVRYAAAYEYIMKNVKSFDIDNGFETLKRSVQEAGGYPTQSSMLFDPAKLEIYIINKQNFGKVWKVSMKKGTIESFRGFKKPVKMALGEAGVLSRDLTDIEKGSLDAKSTQTGSTADKKISGK